LLATQKGKQDADLPSREFAKAMLIVSAEQAGKALLSIGLPKPLALSGSDTNQKTGGGLTGCLTRFQDA